MELSGIVNGNEYSVNIEHKDGDHYIVRIDDREYEVNCKEVMPELYSLIHGSDSYEVRVNKGKNDRIETHFFAESHVVEMADPMKKLLGQATGGSGAGEATLEAPMPGKVLRLLVKEGDQVTEDQGILVLVAMKMENELGSPKSGTVKKILVGEGDSVEGGVPLVIVA